MGEIEEFDGDRVFYTSDTHFYHEAIIKFCHRPFTDKKDMNEKLIENWNSVVKPSDIVFHLGDFAMKCSMNDWIDIRSQLNGKIYLILGNHDPKAFHENGFKSLLFEEVVSHKTIKVNNRIIHMHHYPYLCYAGSYRNEIQLFGHLHLAPNSTGLDTPRAEFMLPTQYDVGVDLNEYKPISHEEVIFRVDKQIKENSNVKMWMNLNQE